MLTLIGRELRDQAVHIVLASLVSAVAIAVAIATVFWGIVGAGLGIMAATSVVLFFVLCALGTAQMYADRANRVSGLLGTLATTRSRILAARVLAGVVVILLSLVPLLITALAILYFTRMPLVFYRGTIAEVSITMALTAFACYCIGLSMGWTASKTIPVLGLLFFVALFVLLVVVKGFGLQGIVLLLLLCVALLLRVWHWFTSVSL
jgi:hypothetical protein